MASGVSGLFVLDREKTVGLPWHIAVLINRLARPSGLGRALPLWIRAPRLCSNRALPLWIRAPHVCSIRALSLRKRAPLSFWIPRRAL